MMNWNDGIGWVGWIVMTLVMVAFWALVIFGIVAIFRSGGKDRPSTPQRHPQEILDERFARGEIDAEEYHSRSGVLHISH